MKQRLIQFCKRKGLSSSAFEKKAGWSPSTIYNLNKGIRSDKLADAARAFPDLDIRWLLTGEETHYETSKAPRVEPRSLFDSEGAQAVKVENLHELSEKLDKLIELMARK